MKSLVLLLCLVGACGTDPVRRFRKVFHVPEDAQHAIESSSKSEEVVEDIFDRLLHTNSWNSFSYNYHNHDHSFTHTHNHHNHHNNNNPYSNDYNDDGYTNPYSNDDDDKEPADFSQAGTNSDTSSSQPTDPKVVYPQDFTPGPSPSSSSVTYPPDDEPSDWVTANEVGSKTPPPSAIIPLSSSETLDPTGLNTASCHLFEACKDLQGDCCPSSEGVYKACCFGVTYPPKIFPAWTQFPVEAPATSQPSDSPTSEPTKSKPTDKPSLVEPPTDKPSEPLVVPFASQRTDTVLEKCGLSETERSERLWQALADSGTDYEEDSPQYQAIEWMDTIDGGVLCGNEESIGQRFSLATTYFALNGGSWTNCSATESACGSAAPWLSDHSECEWFGVACDISSEITVLTLKDNGLAGDLPTELFSLTKLTGLSLDHNKQISGSIPTELGQLTTLEYIELDENVMTGPLPSALYDLTTLKALDLNGNQFNGTIDDNISSLSTLMVLQLEDNAFEGPIPWFGLAMLKDLILLYVHGNNFDGGSLEPICNLLDSRRNEYSEYLQFMAADCGSIVCSCCTQCF